MSTHPTQVPRSGTLLEALRIQIRVIGALMMRELHTRYGRENIGYLWMIGEPLMFGTVIALMHSGQHSDHGGIDPVAFAVTGYSVFIIFRGIVNRSEGALESNLPLLHHRMVTVLDICIARALIEVTGCVCAFFILLGIAISMGYMDAPVRPLYLALGIFYVFWIAFAIGLCITGGSYDRPLFERLVHPATYFMMPISGAFYRVTWLPEPYKSWVQWVPLPHMFETVRYGVFSTADLEYVDFNYVTGWCMALTLLGLSLVSTTRARIHLG